MDKDEEISKLNKEIYELKDELEKNNVLLSSIIGCGYADVDKLIEIIETADKFGVHIGDTIEEIKLEGLNIDFGSIALLTMERTLSNIADEIEDSGDQFYYPKEIAKYLREDARENIFINYLDTWWGLDVLDYGSESGDLIIDIVEEIHEKLGLPDCS